MSAIQFILIVMLVVPLYCQNKVSGVHSGGSNREKEQHKRYGKSKFFRQTRFLLREINIP